MMLRNSTFIADLNGEMHPSWKAFFTPEMESLLVSIEDIVIRTNYSPPSLWVLRFLELDLSKIKVLILGQDPYPQKNRATGRAFEVGGLMRWIQPFENSSLRTIMRSIYKAYTGEVITFNQIRKIVSHAVPNKSLDILEPYVLFPNWESQGVLLLNSALTCEQDQAGSHSDLWHPFTQELLHYINEQNPNIIWFIWGKHAEKVVKDIPIAHKLVNAHPMISKPFPKDMLFGDINPFYETRELIHWLGKE